MFRDEKINLLFQNAGERGSEAFAVLTGCVCVFNKVCRVTGLLTSGYITSLEHCVA